MVESMGFTPNDSENFSPCAFCEVIAGRAPGIMPTRWEDAVVIEPLNPVTEGHVLVVPREHVTDAAENRHVTARVMTRAAEYLKVGPYPGVQPIGPCNIITSCGAEATQTVMHLHVHVVPRRDGDGLQLPWSGELDHLREEWARTHELMDRQLDEAVQSRDGAVRRSQTWMEDLATARQQCGYWEARAVELQGLLDAQV